MLRRFYQTRNRNIHVPRLLVHHQRSTPSSSSCYSSPGHSIIAATYQNNLRSYITQEIAQDKGQVLLRQQQLVEHLGFDPATIPTKQELAIAFKRELSKIMTETAAMIHESSELAKSENSDSNSSARFSKKDSVSSGTALKEASWTRLVEERQLREQDQSLGRKVTRQKILDEMKTAKQSSCALMTEGSTEQTRVLFSDTELIMKIRDNMISRLISTYRTLNNSRFSYLYDNQLDVTPEVMMGYKRGDESFANFDARRQEFHFAKREAKPLSDFTDAYKEAIGVTDGDLENMSEQLLGAANRSGSGGSTADDFLASQATSATAQENIRGTHVQFTLRLSFVEAFTGCCKEITYKRRTTCRFCKGSGKRRQKCQRCPQCAGRGQLQLPSGSALIEKDCSLCLGSGSTLPPDCSACRGTGLGPIENFKQQVQIPAGACEGQTIALRNKGHAGVRGGEDGHCFVTLIVPPHRFFYRDEFDLHVIVPVQLSVILAGGNITVPVLDDDARSKEISVHVENSSLRMFHQDYYSENESGEEKQAGDGTEKQGANDEKETSSPCSSSSSFRSSPMMNDRLIILPEYGMWKEGPVTPSGIAHPKVRGSLYVHCVGVTPNIEKLTKTQRAVLMDHFGGMELFRKQQDEKYYGSGEASTKTTTTHHDDDDDGKNAIHINEAEFAFAKEMCKHWLPQ